MRKHGVLTTAAVVVAPIAAAAALLAGNAFGSPAAGTHTFQFLSVAQTFVASPPISDATPPQVGGRLLFTDATFNRSAQFGLPQGARIGRAEGVCTLLNASKPAAQCVITAHLPNGQLVMVAEGDPGAKLQRYAIVGGIGAYSAARGTVTAVALNPQRSVITINLAQ